MLLAAAMLMSAGAQAPSPHGQPIWGGPGAGEPPPVVLAISPRVLANDRILDQTEDSIDAARRDGSLTHRDAREFKREARRIRAIGWRTGVDATLEGAALALQGRVLARRTVRVAR